MTLIPFLSEWVVLIMAAHEIYIERYEFLVIFFLPWLMCHYWMDMIIPVTSIYQLSPLQILTLFGFYDLYYSEEKPERRSKYSGLTICTIAFVINELFLIGLSVLTKVVILLHLCAIFYYGLSLLNVRYYETLQYDDVYRGVVDTLEEIRLQSRLGFILRRAARGKEGFVNYPFIAVAFWTLGIFLAIKL